MKTKLYTIDVQVDGEWRECNGIDYAEAVNTEMAEMRHELQNLRSHGHKTRLRIVRETNIELLTVKHN